MKKHILKIGIGFVVAVIILTTLFWTLNGVAVEETQATTALRQQILHAKLLEKLSNVAYFAEFWRYSSIAGVSTILSAILIIAMAFYKKSTVHTLKISQYSEIPVKDRDLSNLRDIAMCLAVAERIKSEYPEKAIDLMFKAIELQTGRMKALLGKHGIHGQQEQAAIDSGEQCAIHPHIPSFQELLDSGKIGKGKGLIFGFTESGDVRKGTWEDIYSSAVGGQSGFGKTATLRLLISQSLLQGIEFWIIDYHYPHGKSLLATLGALKDSGLIKYGKSNFDTPKIIKEVNDAIDRRLNNEESCGQVKVIVIDEVLKVVEACPAAGKLIERIGTESRKTGIYGLFSAQSWSAKKTGGSEARDNLTCMFAHRMKRLQANTLLQDSDNAKIAAKLPKGKALFCPANDDPEVLNIPHCRPADMHSIVSLLNGTNGHKSSIPTQVAPATPAKTEDADSPLQETVKPEEDCQPSETDLNPKEMKLQRKLRKLSQTELSELSGVSQAKISDFENGKDRLTPDEKLNVYSVLFPAKKEKTTVTELNKYRNKARK